MKRIFYIYLFFSLIFTSILFANNDKDYVIQKGDTLYGISRKYNISIDELCKANNFTKDSLIKIGQKIKIPIKDVTLHKKQENIMFVPEKTDTYTVKSGDTLYSIAKKFDISVDTLKILNQMSGSIIKVGQKINVPQKVEDIKITKEDKTNNQSSTVVSNIVDPRQIDKSKTASKNLIWPIKPSEINYLKGKISGVLLTGKKSETVNAIKEGFVTFSGFYRGFGQVVFVQASNKLMYVYTGLENISVNKGDKVKFGDKIGTLGIDMHSGKPQLNFMVFKNGSPTDPAKAPRG